MGVQPLRRLSWPTSLRRQLMLTFWALALLVLAGSLTAVHSLRLVAGASRQLAAERLDRMQAAQELVQCTWLIERVSYQLRSAGSLDGMRAAQAELAEQLAQLDRLVNRLSAGSADVAVLALHQSSQLYRNTAYVAVTLHEEALRAEAAYARLLRERTEPLMARADGSSVALAVLLVRLQGERRRDAVEELRRQFVRKARGARGLPPAIREDLLALRPRVAGSGGGAPRDPFSERLRLVERSETVRQVDGELERQAEGMVAAARGLSGAATQAYREAVEELAARSRSGMWWVLTLLGGSLVLARLIFRRFLSQRVLARLQEVSDRLRRSHQGGDGAQLSRRGDDEIGEMSRAVELLLEDQRRLAEANQELEALSYSVSHDMRAPLRHVSGFTALLRERSAGSLDAQSRHYADSIAGAVAQMALLVDGLLSYLHFRRVELVRTTVDVGSVIEEALDEIEPETAGRTIDWKVADFPPVEADRSMLRKVFVHLLSNAVKFTRPRERAEIEIGRTLSADGAEVVLFVRDNGVGFKMEYAAKLFQVFRRLHHPGEFEGAGIGLANVRRIVERHGGRAWAEGAPGRGATFFVALPSTAKGAPPPSGAGAP